MSGITSHVLDTSLGTPADGLRIVLERRSNTNKWTVLGDLETNADGRVPGLFPETTRLEADSYRITFHTGTYFRKTGRPVFYPVVHVHFEITNTTEHYHIPLLLSPFGYSTYRGS